LQKDHTFNFHAIRLILIRSPHQFETHSYTPSNVAAADVAEFTDRDNRAIPCDDGTALWRSYLEQPTRWSHGTDALVARTRAARYGGSGFVL
jgi:hypothetical protein